MKTPKNIRIFDAPEYADRYTVVYLDHQENRGMFTCLGMSTDPFHPQGIGQHGAAMLGDHLGREIGWEELPEPCQQAVLQDLS